MRARIHRGAREIGGNCVELEAEGQRLVLDMGLPLDVEDASTVPLPPIAGLDGTDPSLLGIIISHPHLDHWGLVPRVDPRVPVIIGAAAERILNAAADFSGAEARIRAARHLDHRQAFELGPFRITPYLMDHSAFDAYALLVEAGGRRLVYTGDLRAHGRKRRLFQALLISPPSPVHTLLMEGTLVGQPERPSITEEALEDQLVEDFLDTPGMVLAAFSGQNIDRLVTVYRAAKRAGRRLVMDLYIAALAAATGRRSTPQPGHEYLSVFVPQHQRVLVKNRGEFERVNAVARHRTYPEDLRREASGLVFAYRHSMRGDLERAECLDGARLVWSMWDGYLERSPEILAFCAERNIEILRRHTSGHGSVADLRRLAEVLSPEQLVPLHSAFPERFAEHFPAVQQQADGAWWEA